ncbi:uncharacterized protein LOC124430326 isoform X2 [Vespa crabro]|uniref:uncharacterized protein LOC124430326 isoform X2 n=1 Tax=Vespa crabro TaxID=7445 RepID=UPI001F01451C|nr:uncharacterized protein LOC124430326 isoform X2 [Vespa crabro]
MTVPIYKKEHDPQDIFRENDPNAYQIIDVRNYITTYRRNRPRTYRPFIRNYYNHCNNNKTPIMVYYGNDEDDDNEENNIGSDDLAAIQMPIDISVILYCMINVIITL